MKRSVIIDGIFVLLLMAHVLAGSGLVPFHADEFMFMSLARDSFLPGEAVRYVPPVQPDTPQHLRLLNGPLTSSLIAITWRLSGRDPATLPGIFAWAMDLDWNRANGNVPDSAGLDLARWPSALLTAFGVALIFMMGFRLGKRPAAYIAALLYTVHPVLLMNGRRAMTEGALLACSLLVILVAAVLSRRKVLRWIDAAAFGVCAGFAVIAKHTGIVAASAAGLALIWILLPVFRARLIPWLALAVLMASSIFLLFNRAYWNDPIGAASGMLSARTDLLAMQVKNDPAVYHAVGDRFAAILTQPFMQPPQYFEAPTWNGLLDNAIRDYEASPWSGWRWPLGFGLVLTLFSLSGAVVLAFRALRLSDPDARVVLVALLAVLASSLTVPLGWQRYYLPLFPAMILCAAVIPGALTKRILRRP